MVECICLAPSAGSGAVVIRRMVQALAILTVFFALTHGEEALCASEKAVYLLKQADSHRQALLRSSTSKKYRHNWLNCITRYKKIYRSYPNSDQAAWSLYNSGKLYVGLYAYSSKSSDLDEAISSYRILADKYPEHRLADDAQYLLGEVYYKYKKDPLQAYVEYLKVEIKHPSGDMRPKAKEMLDQLAATLDKKDLERDVEATQGMHNQRVSVNDIRYWSTTNYTRVVVDLESAVKYTHHLLKADPDLNKPRRLYFDLENAKVSPQVESEITIKDGLLQTARAGQYTKDKVRVVLDMASVGGYHVFHLYDPFRIVVDIKKSDKGPEKATTKKEEAKRKVRKGIRKDDEKDETLSLARQLGLSVKRIVIDPGHGGKDPGCLARGGIKEKDITLEMAKILAQKIRDQVGCEVFLTRTRDVFLSLEQRTAIANMKKADLFISLHVNAHRSGRIQGIETYYLNMATDEDAVLLAARENAASEKSMSDLQTILNDLMLNTKLHESDRLAHEVQSSMVSQIEKKYKTAKNLGVKQAPFYVLIGAEMPAILIETGFITNATDKKRLLSKTYHDGVADGITHGIKTYTKTIEQTFPGG